MLSDFILILSGLAVLALAGLAVRGAFRSAEAEIIAAPDAGADDDVTKPFAPAGLLARLRAMVRRRGARSALSVLALGPLRVDLATRTVTRAGAEVRLARKTFDVLALLASKPGRLLMHPDMPRTIWGPAHLADTRTPRAYPRR